MNVQVVYHVSKPQKTGLRTSPIFLRDARLHAWRLMRCLHLADWFRQLGDLENDETWWRLGSDLESIVKGTQLPIQWVSGRTWLTRRGRAGNFDIEAKEGVAAAAFALQGALEN